MKDKTKLINKVDSTTAEIYMYGVIGSGLDIDANVVVAEIEKVFVRQQCACGVQNADAADA